MTQLQLQFYDISKLTVARSFGGHGIALAVQLYAG